MYTCHRYQLCLPFAGSNLLACRLELIYWVQFLSVPLTLPFIPNFPFSVVTWAQGLQELGRGPHHHQHPRLAPPGGAPPSTMPAQGSARALMRGSTAQAAPSTLCACLQTRYSSTPPTFQQQLQLQMLFQTAVLHLGRLVCLAVACLCNKLHIVIFD